MAHDHQTTRDFDPGCDYCAQKQQAAVERVRERCQRVRDRQGPGGMINASQILGLLSPTWPDGNYEAVPE